MEEGLTTVKEHVWLGDVCKLQDAKLVSQKTYEALHRIVRDAVNSAGFSGNYCPLPPAERVFNNSKAVDKSAKECIKPYQHQDRGWGADPTSMVQLCIQRQGHISSMTTNALDTVSLNLSGDGTPQGAYTALYVRFSDITKLLTGEVLPQKYQSAWDEILLSALYADGEDYEVCEGFYMLFVVWNLAAQVTVLLT